MSKLKGTEWQWGGEDGGQLEEAKCVSSMALIGVSLTPSHRDCDKNTIFPDDYISKGWL